MRVLLRLLLIAIHYHANGLLTRVNHPCGTYYNVGNHYFKEEYSVKVGGIPADMKIHWKTQKIFFTLINSDLQMSLKLLDSSKNVTSIVLPALGQSTVIDNTNDIVYLATDNGVFKYEAKANDNTYDGVQQTLHIAKGEDVMYLAVNRDGDAVYIATFPQNTVKRISPDGRYKEAFPLVPNGSGLTLDASDNFYFVATRTPYVLRQGQKVASRIRGLPSDKICAIFVSKSDKVFAMDDNSNIYSVQPESSSAVYLGNFNRTGVNSFAIDARSNVYVGCKGAIVKFRNFRVNPCLARSSKKPMMLSNRRMNSINSVTEKNTKAKPIWSRRNERMDSESTDYFNAQ